MVTITFPDRESEKRALALLLGRFSGRILRTGEHLPLQGGGTDGRNAGAIARHRRCLWRFLYYSIIIVMLYLVNPVFKTADVLVDLRVKGFRRIWGSSILFLYYGIVIVMR